MDTRLKAFSVNGLHEPEGRFVRKHLWQTDQHIPINHKLYVYHRPAIDARDLVFNADKREPKRIPQKVQDELKLIEETLR